MNNYKRSSINYKEVSRLQTKIGYITGFDKIPYEYFDDCEESYYKISLYVFNEAKNLVANYLYTIGEDRIDKEFFSFLKKNFDSLFEDEKETLKSDKNYHFVNVKVKLHFNENNIIAISNVNETKYLLLNDIQTPSLNKSEFCKYIAPLVESKVNQIFEDFQKTMDDFTEFVRYERCDNENIVKIVEKMHILEDVLKRKNTY